jgi:phage terminase large subunit
MTRAKKITLDYKPRAQFLPFHNRKERFACIVAHRRAGKSVACINELIRRAIETDKKDARYAYIAPLFNQAKDVMWGYLKHYAAPLLADSPNESELRVDLVNGSRIRLYGSDNEERLRGIYLDGVVLDEYADMSSSLWGGVIRPMLTDRQGWAVFIGTPRGRDSFHDLWQTARKSDAWFSLELKASETGLLPQEELDAALSDMGRDMWNQEFECSWEASLKGAYYAEELERAKIEGRIGRIPTERALPVHTSWDLGISDSTSIWFAQFVGKEVRLIDYYEASGVALDHYAKVLAEKDYVYGTHHFPHDVAVRELGTGMSRVDTLHGLGIEPEIVPQHNVQDGINATRRFLDRCWIDEVRCERGLECLRHFRREWDDKNKAWKQKPRHDWSSHGADALRYMATGHEERAASKKSKPRRWGPRLSGSWLGA